MTCGASARSMPAIATTAAILAEPPAPVVGYGTCGLARVQIGEAPFPFLRCPLPQGWGCGRVAAAAEARGWWWSQDKKRARVRRVGEKFELRTCAFARIRVVSAAKLSPSSPREKRPPGRRKPTEWASRKIRGSTPAENSGWNIAVTRFELLVGPRVAKP